MPTVKSEGKEPSIALIKSRLTRMAPIPVLISGLKTWKNNPNKTTNTNDTIAETQATVRTNYGTKSD